MLPFRPKLGPLGALSGAAQLRALGISSCCYIINVHNTQPSVMGYVTQKRHGLVL
jgi:hypothetical protein